MHIGMGASAVSENGDSAEHEGWLTIAGERGVVDLTRIELVTS